MEKKQADGVNIFKKTLNEMRAAMQEKVRQLRKEIGRQKTDNEAMKGELAALKVSQCSCAIETTGMARREAAGDSASGGAEALGQNDEDRGTASGTVSGGAARTYAWCVKKSHFMKSKRGLRGRKT